LLLQEKEEKWETYQVRATVLEEQAAAPVPQGEQRVPERKKPVLHVLAAVAEEQEAAFPVHVRQVGLAVIVLSRYSEPVQPVAAETQVEEGKSKSNPVAQVMATVLDEQVLAPTAQAEQVVAGGCREMNRG
jgi:hypothetical protein